jgi:MFS transporter, FSR family, fosmidomycin resistance protein
VQHPRASLLVTNAYGKASRGPLGIYNFAGDLGKAIFPAAVALLLPVFAWRPVVRLMSLVGLAVALTMLALVPQQRSIVQTERADAQSGNGRGFSLLLAIGALDTAARMGYLLFLPFLLRARGGNEAIIGIGLAMLFAGGALGKACCGWLGKRLWFGRLPPFRWPSSSLAQSPSPRHIFSVCDFEDQKSTASCGRGDKHFRAWWRIRNIINCVDSRYLR